MTDINTLKQLAGLGNESMDFDVEQAIGDSWIQRKEEFLVSSQGLAPAERFSKFKERMSGYKFTHNNVDSYYDSWIALYPGSNTDAVLDLKNDLWGEVEGLPSDSERGDWIQQNLRRVPTAWRGEMAEMFQRTREKDANKDYERARITGVLQAKDMQNKLKEKYIDPDKSVDSHIRSFVKAQTAGLLDTLDIDEEGDFSVLTENGRVKSYTLEDNTDPMSSFLSYHDAEQSIRERLVEQQAISSKVKRDTVDRATGALRRNLTDIPREFQANVIADWALLQDEANPVDYIRAGIREVITSKIKIDKVSSPDELIWEYINLRDEVLGSYLGRNIDGQSK